MKKTYIIICSALAIIIGVIIYITFLSMPSVEIVERDFERNSAHMIIIRDFLAEQEHSSVFLFRGSPWNATMSLGEAWVMGDSKRAPVNNIAVLWSLNNLYWRGIGSIYRLEYGIVFSKCCCQSYDGESRIGFVYFMDGRGPQNSNVFLHLIEIESLPKEGWYIFTNHQKEFQRRVDVAREEFFVNPELDWLEDELSYNAENFIMVKDFLMNQDRRYIRVNARELSNNEMFENGYDNDEVLGVFCLLFRQGFGVVKRDSAIAFERRCRIRQFGYGILYAPYGITLYDLNQGRPGLVSFPIILEPSSKEGWYFFVSDIIEWRKAMELTREAFFANPNFDFIEGEFYARREYLYAARDFLLSKEYTLIEVHATLALNLEMRLRSDAERRPIDNDKALEAFTVLILDNRFRPVHRRYDNIIFSRINWNLGHNSEYGFIYSTNLDALNISRGHGQRTLANIVLLESSSIENWYFFISDSQEWRRINSN